jgi:glycosyltransferase involved in cell wall biosynthesis
MSPDAAVISVIIPCYRSQHFIARPVCSLLAQDFASWEAILVSDDGNDYAALLAEQGITDPRLKFASTGGIGTRAANARNIGLDHANAPLVAYLDNDDAFAPSYLESVVPLVRRHGVVFSNHRLIDDASGTEIPFFDVLDGQSGLYDLARFPLLMALPTAISIAHDRMRVPARWYRDTIIAEDILFLLQCYAHVDRIYASAAPLYDYYNRADSASHNASLVRRFVKQKEILLEAAKAGALLADTPALSQGAVRCLDIALAAERRYAELLPKQSGLLYADCIVEQLKITGYLHEHR